MIKNLLLLASILSMGIPARSAECSPDIRFTASKYSSYYTAPRQRSEAENTLKQLFCEIKEDVTARGVAGLGKRQNRIMQYLGGQRRIKIIFENVSVAGTDHRWRIMPIGKRMYLSRRNFTNKRETFFMEAAGNQIVEVIWNAREDLKNTLLHELTHAAKRGPFTLMNKEKEENIASTVANTYYPQQGVMVSTVTVLK